MGLFNKLFRGAPRIGLSNEDRGAAKIAERIFIMGFRQSLYNGTRSFLKDSESAAQWTPAVGAGLAIGAGYGMLNGIVSDNTSVFGGTVGGGVLVLALGQVLLTLFMPIRGSVMLPEI